MNTSTKNWLIDNELIKVYRWAYEPHDPGNSYQWLSNGETLRRFEKGKFLWEWMEVLPSWKWR